MNSVSLWIARLFPPAAVLAHAAAAYVTLYRHEQTGILIILTLWGAALIYCLAFHAGGDFIQRTIGLQPWSRGDDFQTGMRRASMAFSYWLVLVGASLMLGFNTEVFTTDGLAEANARAIVLQLMTVIFAGALSPTAYLGWRLKPLAQDG